MKRRIFVVDANDGPCVRSLFTAISEMGWDVFFFRPYGFGYYRKHRVASWFSAYRWKSVSDGISQSFIPVPGIRRFTSLSLSIVRHVMCSAERQFGAPDVVVYTMPYYAALVEESQWPSMYFAYDPYRLYLGWNFELVTELEDRILAKAGAVGVISRQMELDWKGKTSGRLQYIPNATHSRLVDAYRQDVHAKPPDLAALSGPVVGCIGNISRGYDWDLIIHLSKMFPETNFVFLGTVIEKVQELDLIRGLANVHMLGHKEHSVLPAYLRYFDVCFNPLALNALNHRRCPLRLYDYLATDKPVLSTAINEAVVLRDYLAIGNDSNECAALLAKMLDGEYVVDMNARRRFIAGQTWEKRAEQFVELLNTVH